MMGSANQVKDYFWIWTHEDSSRAGNLKIAIHRGNNEKKKIKGDHSAELYASISMDMNALGAVVVMKAKAPTSDKYIINQSWLPCHGNALMHVEVILVQNQAIDASLSSESPMNNHKYTLSNPRMLKNKYLNCPLPIRRNSGHCMCKL